MTPQRKIDRLIGTMHASPVSVSFWDLERVCQHYFGPPRVSSGSHRIYATPWQGDPRVNIQNNRGSAKPYQVRQVLAALERLRAHDNTNEEGDNDA